MSLLVSKTSNIYLKVLIHKKIIKMVKKKLGIVVGKIKSKTNKHSKYKEGVSKANASQVPTLNVSTKIITPLSSKQNLNYDVGKKHQDY